jgi:hypothetical protein
MFHNFRNQNALQPLQGKQHEVAEFEGDKMVGARGFEPPTPWSEAWPFRLADRLLRRRRPLITSPLEWQMTAAPVPHPGSAPSKILRSVFAVDCGRATPKGLWM